MLRTIRSKLFLSFGILGLITVFLGAVFLVIFQSYKKKNEVLLEKNFPQLIRASKFISGKNKIINLASLIVSAKNKSELVNSYKIINKDLEKLNILIQDISSDPHFKNIRRFNQLSQEIKSILDITLQLRVKLFLIQKNLTSYNNENGT